MKIKHLNREIDTSHYNGNIDKELVNHIKNNYYNENKDMAIKQLEKVLNGGSVTNHIYNYYFDRIANDTIVGTAKWSINEALESDELVQAMYNKTLINDKVFNSKDVLTNFKTAIRLAGAGYFKRPTQFPIKVMRSLVDKYSSEKDVYYDPCMGWGIRMLVAAEKNLTYIGNDTNKKLIEKLNELSNDINKIKEFNTTLYSSGSEVFIPELENNVDFIFTSPPYFDLEQYSDMDLKGDNYSDWLDNFLEPMLYNCYKYIKDDKYVLINIKNTSKYSMYDDALRIAEKIGFVFVKDEQLKQTNRTHIITKHGDSSERIIVLKKENV